MRNNKVILSRELSRHRWDDFVAHSHLGHLMQTSQWGDFKAALGWKVHRIGVECDGSLVAGAQIFLRPLPLFPLTVAYIPKGPIVDFQTPDITVTLLSAIHQTAQEHGAIFLKIEPNLLNADYVHKSLTDYGFQHTPYTNQPRCTLVIELSDGEDVIMSNMRKTTRKLIRRAGREGVQVINVGEKGIEDFYKMLESTSEAKDLSLHNQVFYEQAWKALQDNNAVQLFLAKYQGKTVAGKMIAVYKGRSMHLWGGTSLVGRDVYASYLLQWEAIRWAIAHECQESDLWGIPDEIADIQREGRDIPKDKTSGLWGVYTFKRGFGGEIECYVGAYDYVYRPLIYRLIMAVMRNRELMESLYIWWESVSRRIGLRKV